MAIKSGISEKVNRKDSLLYALLLPSYCNSKSVKLEVLPSVLSVLVENFTNCL